jgi:ubiquinone/menaquinone biosynthesis C-methylase UbiE
VHLLEQWPALYRLVSKVYYTFNPEHLREMFIGTKAREMSWAKPEIGAGYWATRDHSSKAFLVEKIAAHVPIASVLEVGCASGPNVYAVAGKFPGAQITGIDINPEAIAYGTRQFAKEGIPNVRLLVGKAGELSQFPDRSFDIVFTNAMLIYIGPDKIREVIKDLLRVTGRALILMELYRPEKNGDDKRGLGNYQHDNWVRDYTKLLEPFVAGNRLKITRIPREVWPDRPWRDLGAVIEVTIS